MQELGIGVVSGLKKNKLQIITGGDDIHPIPTDETSRINKLLSKPIPNLSYTYINYSLHLNELFGVGWVRCQPPPNPVVKGFKLDLGVLVGSGSSVSRGLEKYTPIYFLVVTSLRPAQTILCAHIGPTLSARH